MRTKNAAEISILEDTLRALDTTYESLKRVKETNLANRVSALQAEVKMKLNEAIRNSLDVYA